MSVTATTRLEPGVIYVDSRVGSRELAPLFQKRHGRRVSVQLLESADVAFCCGHRKPSPYCKGEYGCRIGFERKTLSDLVGSLLKNRVGGRQLPLMLEGYTRAWFVIEGLWRPGADDSIEIPKNGSWVASPVALPYSSLEGWMTRYEVMSAGHMLKWRTATMIETAAFIAAKQQWWNKEWDKHSLGVVDKMGVPDKILLRRLNQKERTISSLPEVGFKTLLKVARKFSSIHEAMNSSVQAWQRAGLGKKDARTIFEEIRKEYR